MTDLTIKFENNEVTLPKNKEGLYRLNTVANAAISGLENPPQGRDLRKMVRDRLNGYTEALSERQEARFAITKIKDGKRQGTYGNEKSVYWLAAKFDEDFEDTVFEAFNAAVDGQGEQAVQTAQQVARIKSKEIRRYETEEIKEYQECKGVHKTTQGHTMFGEVTAVTNMLLGIEKGQRDLLTTQQFNNVVVADRIVAVAFQQGGEWEASYDQIITLIKRRLRQYCDITQLDFI